MIVDQFSSGTAGGAGIAACRLHEALKSTGVTSRFWHEARAPRVDNDPTYAPVSWPATASTLSGAMADRARYLATRVQLKCEMKFAMMGRPSGLEHFSIPRLARPTRYDPAAWNSDILHLHWVDKLIDYPTFFSGIPDDFPIVWTLHDMNPMTGGCHYSGGCDAFASECHSCPQIARPGPRDVTRRSFQVKRDAYRRKNLHIVTPSHWLENEVRRSTLLSGARSIQTILCGLDTTIFRPHARQSARQAWNLPADRVIIGFGAAAIDNRRKGLHELMTALSRLTSKDRVMGLVFGRGAASLVGPSIPEIRNVGYVTDPVQQASLYSAVDLVTLPSLEENGGLIGGEAMACGVPVVAFASGGIPEFVRHQETGLLAETGNPIELARQLQWMLDHPEARQRMGSQARSFAVREYEIKTQTNKHLALYSRLLDERRFAKSA